MPYFLRRLGEMMNVLAQVAQKAQTENGPNHVVLNVRTGKPVWVGKACKQ